MSASLILALILFLLALLATSLYKAYFSLPLFELKRRARDDAQAAKLYQAASYDRSLRAYLWLVIVFASGSAIVLSGRKLALWSGLIVAGLVLLIVFNLVAQSRLSKFERLLGVWLSPFVKLKMNYFHRPLDYLAVHLKPAQARPTGLFEPADLMQLLKVQAKQPDSRFSEEELKLLKKAAFFSNLTVSQALNKKVKPKKVTISDVIGPILINDIHRSGLPFALVLDKPKGEVVGTLAFNSIGIHSTGSVQNFMNDKLFYLHEDDTLADAFTAASLTHSPVFIVLSSSGQNVGVVTTSGLLNELLGKVSKDSFADFDNKEAVLKRHQADRPKETTEQVVE